MVWDRDRCGGFRKGSTAPLRFKGIWFRRFHPETEIEGKTAQLASESIE